jgi:hypothetical protein
MEMLFREESEVLPSVTDLPHCHIIRIVVTMEHMTIGKGTTPTLLTWELSLSDQNFPH